tara:strand:- start:53 stop:508 length:456 start_codon:yes stop_codon:yes gene_type:complete
MTKLREPLSIEFILKQALPKLGDEEVKKSTGKSISHFRKCGDTDDKDHNIHLVDAIKLDILLQKKKFGNPFLDHFNFKLEYSLRKVNEYENISSVLINIGGRIGNLMDITQEAINPKGESGSSISNDEKQKIFNAVNEVEEKIAKLKLSIK